VRVGLGCRSDRPQQRKRSNLMQEVRAAFLLATRAAYGVERVSHLDALRWATTGSARVHRPARIGRHRGRCTGASTLVFRLMSCVSPAAGDPLAALVLAGPTMRTE